MALLTKSSLAPMVFALVTAATVVAAQDRPAAWVKRPSRQELVGVWPVAAMKNGQGGKAVVSCMVTLQGALRDCHVVSESPRGAGFGAAGVALTAQLTMRPAVVAGTPVESEVKIPFTWEDQREGSALRLDGPSMLGGIATRVVLDPGWLRAPSITQQRAAYPEKARATKVDGRSTLDCAIARTGALNSCAIIQEEPVGYGFGAAAKRLSTLFVAPTTDASGAALAGAHVQIPVAFAIKGMDGEQSVIGKPQWKALPGAADLASVYPPGAIKAGIRKARVVLSCTVAEDGALAGCAVESEDPAGYGLGEATVGLAGTFRLGVWSAEGLPTVGGVVRVPIRFDFGQEPPLAKP